jgi:hypothetical protein
MSRKIISLFTLLAFIVFSLSCYSWKKKEIKTAADWQRKKGKILWVIKTSGEYIEFSKDNPGRIIGDKIVGKAIILSKKVVIDRANIKRIKRDRNRYISKIISKDGKVYHVITGTVIKEKDKIIFTGGEGLYESVSIPLSEVKSVQVKRFDPFTTLFAGAGLYLLVFAAGIVVLAYVLTKD